MVVAALALLFIIGSTFLLVATFDRQTVAQHAAARDLHAVADAVQAAIIRQLREDAVGHDGIPCNRGWGGDRSALEDCEDLAGRAGADG